MHAADRLFLSGRLFFILLLSPWILIVSVPVIRGLNLLLTRDEGKIRKRKASAEFRKGLKSLSRKDIPLKDVFSGTQQLFSRYLEGRLGIKAGGMTREELLHSLSRVGAKEETLTALKDILEKSDALRYSSMESTGAGKRGKEGTIAAFSRLLSELDRLS